MATATAEPTHTHTTGTVSVVLPAYNEAEHLTEVITELLDVLDGLEYGFEVIVVDDGSTDDTRHRVRHLAALFDPVIGLCLSRNYGQSAALKAGIDQARGEFVVTMDADGQNDPSDIPALLQRLESGGYDCVSGYRQHRQDPLGKRLPSRVQTILAKATGPTINDFGCTLKAYRSEAIRDIDLYGEGHRYIPAKLYKRGYRVGEEPVNHRSRRNGSSRYGTGRLLRGFVDLVYHYFDVHFSTRPMHLLGGAGMVSMGLGVTIGLLSVLQKYAFGIELAPRLPRLVLVALLVITGLQLFVFGFLAEMVTRLEYRDRSPYRLEEVVE